MTTKQKILEESLALFAEKGYTAVYVADIAKAVGIKAPSLYKHYRSKQEIFDSCIKVFYERMRVMTGNFSILNKSITDVTEEMFFDITQSIFLFYLHDEIASKLRKMLSIERYGNEKLNAIYVELFLDEPIRFETGLFDELIHAGILKQNDPAILAYRYYTLLFFLLIKYDMHPADDREALQELKKVTKDFFDSYKEVPANVT